MKRLLFIVALGVVILALVMFARTLTLESKQVEVAPVQPAAVDGQRIAEELSRAIQFQTVSYEERDRVNRPEFLALHGYLEEAFPEVHRNLEKEKVGDLSLLYTWQGAEPDLPPAVLMAHQDVVPVEPGSEKDWTHLPYAGAIAEGFVWGRGTLDDKASLVGALHAVESLLSDGFQPRRTVYLAFGHDEEVGGDEGALKIAEKLGAAGVRPGLVVDEGGAIFDGSMMGLSRPIAVVGIAEKGYVNLELTAEVRGGHSSVPPRDTAVGILARAIANLEENQVRGGLRPPVSQMLEYLGPEMPFFRKAALANLWLLGGLVEWAFERNPVTNAMVRTTTAATIFEAGVKANVLPSRARAVVNFRILPGDTVESVTEHVRQAIDDERVGIRVMEAARNPSDVSSLESPAWTSLQKSIRELYPDVAVAPTLLVGGSDAKHFTSISNGVYRFAGIQASTDDLQRAHGRDERISVENLEKMVRFYIHLVRNWSAGAASPAMD